MSTDMSSADAVYLSWVSRETAGIIAGVEGGGDTYAISPEVAIRVLEARAMKAFTAFVEKIRGVPSVEHVVAEVSGTEITVTTCVSESKEKERFSIYDAEEQILDEHPDLDLDFQLLDRKGYPVEYAELGPHTYIEVIQRRPDRYDANWREI